MNTNELTRLTTNDLSKATIVTDSWIISENLNRKHDTVTRSIKRYQSDIEEFGEVRPVVEEVDGSRSRVIYELNEGQATFLMTLMNNSDKVIEFKKMLVKSFLFMKHELTARHETRFIGKTVRNDLTKSISENIPPSNFKNFAHSNYTRLIYKKVLGMQVNKWKAIEGLNKTDKPRDFMNKEQLEKVQVFESKIADIIEFNTDEDPKILYAKIKDFINKYQNYYTFDK